MINDFSFENLFVNQTCTFTHQITQENQDDFCKISGDINPLHIDESFAKTKGFPGCVVYGMLVASLYSTLAGVYLPGKNCLLQSVDVSFVKPVFVNDILRVEGKIVEKHELFRQITIKASIYNQNDKKISRATIKAGVLDE